MKLALSLSFVLLSAIPAAATDIYGRASVIDGDTIEIHNERIRLWGIDAVETGQLCQVNGKSWRCGRDAAFALDGFLNNVTVECSPKDRDRYGRTVATCTAREIDVGRWLVLQGWALDYTRYSNGEYADAQIAAKAAKRGLWAGEFMPPWEWRHR
jgi:endonuclease YncB( thermonuclease family)